MSGDEQFRAEGIDLAGLAAEAQALMAELFPLPRSLTGAGVRATLARLAQVAPFATHEVPSGSACYDWTVPEEWSVRQAFIADAQGRRVVDWAANNLHLVGYSVAVDRVMGFNELRPRLHTLPGMPEAIPYRTSYYQRDWGFCLSQRQLEAMDPAGTYRVVIEAEHAPGSLTYAQAVLPGSSGREFLFTSYCCHPSLANDNLSGPVLWALLLRELGRRPHRHGYRFYLGPETIGALCYLSRHFYEMERVEGGFVLTCVAGPGPLGYKPTWQGDHLIDRVARRTFAELGLEPVEHPFDVLGSDERQFSAPAFRLAMASIVKDKYHAYPQYHTSADDLAFVSGRDLAATLGVYLAVIERLEANRAWRSLNPHGEPMLGRRGLYPALGGAIAQPAAASDHAELTAMRWVLFFSDGRHDLLAIAEKSGLTLPALARAATKLVANGLLEPA